VSEASYIITLNRPLAGNIIMSEHSEMTVCLSRIIEIDDWLAFACCRLAKGVLSGPFRTSNFTFVQRTIFYINAPFVPNHAVKNPTEYLG